MERKPLTARSVLYVMIGAMLVLGGSYVMLVSGHPMPGEWISSVLKFFAGLIVFAAGGGIIGRTLYEKPK